jgi:hypothetical protein
MLISPIPVHGWVGVLLNQDVKDPIHIHTWLVHMKRQVTVVKGADEQGEKGAGTKHQASITIMLNYVSPVQYSTVNTDTLVPMHLSFILHSVIKLIGTTSRSMASSASKAHDHLHSYRLPVATSRRACSASALNQYGCFCPINQCVFLFY